ncbi:PQ-loop repeat family protein/transmembrane family protein [Forsythia ovata]|uniref:PQ-loop repeat family protein/transmembrane family protein n=1 Tax=Forsythia ovata TaxID=205694 RepID=A0ABD1SPI4_9LAMI
MGMLKISQVTCPTDQNCSQWAKKHMDYCLCSKKDGVSLALGLISVLTWSVAEIPQIITNYKQKSTHGLSILFLLTWVIQAGGIDKKQVNNAERLGNAPSSPIPLPAISHDSSHEELYYMSARSLSISHTPAEVSFQPRRTPDAEEHGAREPLLGEARSTQSAPPLKTKTMLCVVSLMTFFIGGLNLQQAETGRHNIDFRNPTSGVVLQVGRQIFQVTEKVTGEFEKETSVTKSSEIGSFLGWGMAAIYLGGRLPQICLNLTVVKDKTESAMAGGCRRVCAP